jgi:hypothetical protein
MLNLLLEAKLTAEPRAFYIDTRNLTCYFSNWLDWIRMKIFIGTVAQQYGVCR